MATATPRVQQGQSAKSIQRLDVLHPQFKQQLSNVMLSYEQRIAALEARLAKLS